jgi:hypothetical protein
MNDHEQAIKFSEAIKFIGLIGSIATALSGQSDLIPVPYNKIVTIIGIATTSIFGWLMHPPRDPQARERREDFPDFEIPENTK